MSPNPLANAKILRVLKPLELVCKNVLDSFIIDTEAQDICFVLFFASWLLFFMKVYLALGTEKQGSIAWILATAPDI